jgi:hypothetical protein
MDVLDREMEAQTGLGYEARAERRADLEEEIKTRHLGCKHCSLLAESCDMFTEVADL